MRVELVRGAADGVWVHLSAVIETPGGALVIEGQDLGPAADEMWGDSDYEYWVTVPAGQRRRLLELLITERFGDDAGALVAWLSEQRVRFAGSSGGTIERVEVEKSGAARAVTAEGVVTVDGSESDRLTLGLVRDLFASGRFHTDVDFRSWLTGHGVPTEFASY